MTAQPSTSTSSIVGAGLSGIGAACRLSVEHPHRTVAVLEARDASGGTWDVFRYPGIRSDSDMFTFGFRWRPWARTGRWPTVRRSSTTCAPSPASTASTG